MEAKRIETSQWANRPVRVLDFKQLDAKKAGFALATNELAQATRNLARVLERCAKGE